MLSLWLSVFCCCCCLLFRFLFLFLLFFLLDGFVPSVLVLVDVEASRFGTKVVAAAAKVPSMLKSELFFFVSMFSLS